MMKVLAVVFSLALLSLVLTVSLVGQQPVNQADGPPSGTSIQTVWVYSGSNVIGICWSPSTVSNSVSQVGYGVRPSTSVAISAVSKAAAAVATSTGHGFDINSRPSITIKGATGTGWTGINATWTATILTADTFSIPINSTGFATLGGTVTFITTAPRKTVAEWSVQVISYSGSNAVWKGWLGGSSSFAAKCSDAASASLGVQ